MLESPDVRFVQTMLMSVPQDICAPQDDLLFFLGLIFLPSETESVLNAKMAERFYLHDILESVSFDCDRADYTLRDGLHLGFADQDALECLKLLTTCRVVQETKDIMEKTIPEGLRKECSNGTLQRRNRIAWNMEPRGEGNQNELMSRFLTLRRHLHRDCYEDPRKLAFDETLCKLIFHSFDQTDEMRRMGRWSDKYAEVFKLLLDLTDEQLLSVLTQVQDSIAHPQRVYLRGLLDDLHHNRPAVPLFYYCRDSDQSGIWHLKKCRSPTMPDELLAHKTITDDSGLIPVRDFVIYYTNEFIGKLKFESNLWAALLNNPDNKELSGTRNKALRDRFTGIGDEQIKTINEHFPQVLVTIPRYLNIPSEDPNAARKSPDRDPTKGEPYVLLHDDVGNPHLVTHELGPDMARKRLRLVVSVPQELLSVNNLLEIIHAALLDEIKKDPHVQKLIDLHDRASLIAPPDPSNAPTRPPEVSGTDGTGSTEDGK
jgi:hypothetical protein